MELFPHVLSRKTHQEAGVEAAEGMDRSESHSGLEWQEYAVRFIKWYCTKNRRFFPPDVWEAGLEVPVSPRAMGPVISRLMKEGVIRPIMVDGYTCCWPNQYRHNAMTPVYESLVYSVEDSRPF